MDILEILGRHRHLLPPRMTLPGRDEPIRGGTHRVLGTALEPPWPDTARHLVVGGGCFWYLEQLFWAIPGVHTTRVGYAGGSTPNPTYDEVQTGETNHAHVVDIVYHPDYVELHDLLRTFWEGHDPTQRMRQGSAVGTQYRSIILYTTAQEHHELRRSRDTYQQTLTAAGYGTVATEIAPNRSFYLAEPEHQQYFAAQLNDENPASA